MVKLILLFAALLIPGKCSNDANHIIPVRRDESGSTKKLPSISDITSLSGPFNHNFDINGCQLEASMTECKYSFIPSKKTCEGKIPLGDILNHFFPSNKLAEKTKTFLLPDKFDLIKLVVDKCISEVDFEASSREKFEIIPKRLSISNANIQISLNYKTGSVEWSKLALDISGDISISKSKVNVKLDKKKEETAVNFKFQMDELSIPDFLKLFTAAKPDDEDPNEGDEMDRAAWNTAKIERERYLEKLRSASLGQKREKSQKDIAKRDDTNGGSNNLATDEFTNLVIKKPKISGMYDPEGKYEFVMSGLPSTAFFTGTIYAVVQKPKEGNTAVGVIASLENVSPTQILSKVTGKDLSTVPLLKDITINFAVMFANDEIPMINNPEILSALKDYIGEGKAICKGVVFKMELPVKEIIKKVGSELDVSDVPDTIYCKIIVKDGKVDIKFPDNWKTDLLKILSAISPKAVELLPAFLKGTTPYIDVKVLRFDYKTMIFTGHVIAPGPIKIQNIFSLKNVDIKVTFNGKKNNWDFSFSSTQELFESVTFSTSLSKKGPNYSFDGHIALISTGQLIKWLGTKFASDEVMEKFSFLDFGIENFKIQATFSRDSMDFALRLAGTGIMFGWNGIKVEGILSVKQGMPHLIFGIVFKDVRLDEIVSKLFNKKLMSATWLTEMNVGLVISTTKGDKSQMQFTLPELKKLPLQPGFWLRAIFQPPNDCKKDELCLQAKEIMKDEKKEPFLSFEGQITLAGAEFRAEYEGNWKIGSNVKVQDIALTVSVGKTTGVWFSVHVVVVNPELKLEGKIKVGPTGSVTLSAKMKGIWKAPFGLKYLAFGNIQISIGIQPGVPIPLINFEGEMSLGKIDSGNEIKSIAAVGIDPTNPMKSYFYAEINKLTLGSLAEAFGHTLALPKVLLDTGFPEGLVASFTLGPGRKLEMSGIELPSGFAMQGTINLFGLNLKCKIVVNFPSKFEINVHMSPITCAGGALELRKTREDNNEGPMFYAKVTSDSVRAELRGFVNILGISSQVVIKIDDTGYYFAVDGNLFGVISANLTVEAGFQSIEKANFKVSSCLSVTAADVENEVKSSVKEAADEAQEAVEEAKQKVKSVTDLGSNAKEGKEKLENEIEEYQKKIQKKAERYREAKEFTKVECLEKCQTVCLGGVDWNTESLKVDGEPIGYPVWNECKFKVLDEKCFAKCKGKSWLKRKVASAKQTGLKILKKIFSQIRKMFNLGKKFFQAAKQLISEATDMLSKVTDKMKAGIEMAKNIAKHALKNVIEIKHMCFAAALKDAATNACVEIDIDAVAFKTREIKFKTQGCLDVSFAKSIATAIADKISPGISRIKEGLSKVRTLIKKVDSRKEEVTEEIEAGQDEEDEGSEDDVSVDKYDNAAAKKRYRQWNETLSTANKLANEELPRLVLKESKYVRQLHENSAPIVTASHPLRYTFKFKSTENRTKGSFRRHETKNDNACGKMLNVVHRYKDLTTNLQRLVRKSDEQKKAFTNTKIKESRDLDQIASTFRAQCVYYSCRKDELNDIMQFVDKARDNQNKWAKIVESQIKNQDFETVNVWRRSLNDISQEQHGINLREYFKKLRRDYNTASKRVWIPKMQLEDQQSNLSQVASKLEDIFVSGQDMTITKVGGILQKLEPYLNAVGDTPMECRNPELKVE